MISALHYMASHLGVYTIAKGGRQAHFGLWARPSHCIDVRVCVTMILESGLGFNEVHASQKHKNGHGILPNHEKQIGQTTTT